MFDCTLLDILHAIWLLLLIAILMTPIIPGMNQAGLYGKLRQQHKKEVGVGVGEEGEEEKRQEQKEHKASSAASASSSAFLHFFLNSPYLAIPTATAFRAYYVFATLWNGILLYDVVTISSTSSYEDTLVLHSLHDLAHTSGWFRSPTPTTTTATTSDSPLTRVSDASLAPMMLHIALFELHFVRRVYESYYVAAFSKQSTQHLLVTIMGQKSSHSSVRAYKGEDLLGIVSVSHLDSFLHSAISRSFLLFPLRPYPNRRFSPLV